MKYLQKVLIILSMPFIYARYSFVLFLPLLIHDTGEYNYPFYLPFIVISSHYALIFMLIGYSEKMVSYIRFFQKLTMVDFQEGKKWAKPDVYSFSYWKHPTIVVNQKEIEIRIATMGGSTYTYDYHLIRKAIFHSLF